MKKINLSKNYSRRSIIKSLGITAAAPFIPVLEADADGNQPKRLLVVTTPSGHGNGYLPSNPGANYTNGPAFKVLDPHKQDINILRGVDFKAYVGPVLADGRTYNVTNSHPALAPHLLTAAFTSLENPNDSAGNQEAVYHSEGVSIDQFISQRLMANPNTQTGLPFIFAGVKTRRGVFHHQVYRTPGTSLFPQVDAPTLLDEIFDASSTGGGSNNADFQKRVAVRRSVIDFAKSQIDSVNRVLANADKQKMEAHLEAIRELERQLTFQENAGSLSCAVPTLKEEIGFFDERMRIDGENMVDLIVQAFACDRTRVATLMWAAAADNTTFRSIGVDIPHHALTHGGIFGAEKTRQRDLTTGWYAARFAYLLEKMKSIPEGDGTMLDNTLIIWTSEHSNETREHERVNIPYVLAGSACGAVRTGRYFDFSSDRRSHGDVYVTAAHAMGFTDVQTFGIPDVSDGPLPGLLA